MAGSITEVQFQSTKKEATMLPYHKERICPKCGTPGADVKFVSDTMYGGRETYEREGYMKRTCVLCGYVWKELPLDKVERA